jgi:hypothetical protein
MKIRVVHIDFEILWVDVEVSVVPRVGEHLDLTGGEFPEVAHVTDRRVVVRQVRHMLGKDGWHVVHICVA